jgi:hypothetical protein
VGVGQCPSERLPWWAAHWLTQGWNGDALRTSTELNGSDLPAVGGDLMSEVFTELSVTVPSSAVVAANMAFGHLVRMCLEGQTKENWVVQKRTA